MQFSNFVFSPADPLLPITFSKSLLSQPMNDKKKKEEEEEKENYLTASVTRLQTSVYKTNQALSFSVFHPPP